MKQSVNITFWLQGDKPKGGEPAQKKSSLVDWENFSSS